MKYRSFTKSLVLVGLVFAFASPLGARASDGDLWPQIDALISRCTARTYTLQDGQKTYGQLRPTCDDVRLEGQGERTRAFLRIADEWYMVTIENAADSDGGDLNNVYVFDSDGSTVAQRREVPAFGDILLALSVQAAP